MIYPKSESIWAKGLSLIVHIHTALWRAHVPNMVLAAAGLFVDHKKGEIPELKNLLRDSSIDKVGYFFLL